MNPSVMKKWHHTIGIIIALFIVIQAGSGLLLTTSELHVKAAQSSEGHEHGHDEQGEQGSALHALLGWLHYGSGTWMAIYRTLLGVALLAQTVLGVVLFFDIRRRAHHATSRQL